VFGLRQAKATHGMQVLRPVWRNTLRAFGAAPSRRAEALHARLGVAVPAGSLDSSPAEAEQSAPPTRGSPFCHGGPERPIPRPHDATAPQPC
jgi:hypothetical protein